MSGLRTKPTARRLFSSLAGYAYISLSSSEVHGNVTTVPLAEKDHAVVRSRERHDDEMRHNEERCIAVSRIDTGVQLHDPAHVTHVWQQIL
jgi:hypothetical protein